MSEAAVPLLDSFSALADPTRCRMLLLLDGQELTVSELCAALQLPQSTVSRHLKTLSDADWVASRRDGTKRYYALALGPRPAALGDAPGKEPHHGPASDATRAEIWRLTRDQLKDSAGAAQDARRLERVLAKRRDASRQFFASAAHTWDRLRDDLFGDTFYLRASLALLDATLVVGDLGCGTGVVTAALAPHVARVIGVDASEEMLAAARGRLARANNVDLRAGALEALPIANDAVDAATLMLVLHHLPAPAAALGEAARVLKPGGRIVIVDMAPHEREEYRQQMGHVWLGFSEEQVRRLLSQAGFERIGIHPLPPAAEAQGPALFVAVGTKSLT